MKNSGQILLPGLAAFLALLSMTFLFVHAGQRVLRQMRLESAAQATTLSAARAQAVILNKFASHNLEVNAFVWGKYGNYGVIQRALVTPLKLEVGYQKWVQYPQFMIYPYRVAKRVARLNAPKAAFRILPATPHLAREDLELVTMTGIYPSGFVEIEDAYYVRTWKPGSRRAQPPHTTVCWLKEGALSGGASAKLYLDVRGGDDVQNGGFPRPMNNEDWYGNLELQSFYPQFNARLLEKALVPWERIAP